MWYLLRCHLCIEETGEGPGQIPGVLLMSQVPRQRTVLLGHPLSSSRLEEVFDPGCCFALYNILVDFIQEPIVGYLVERLAEVHDYSIDLFAVCSTCV